MLAIPVVEVKAGRCVHTHSEATRKKVIMDDPLEVFTQLMEQGASQIKLVDVDAIRNRQPEHLSLIGRIKKHCPSLKIQVSGGVSSTEDIQIWLDAGADWVTVGGRMMRQQEKLEMILVEFGSKLIVGLDVRESLWRNGYSPVVGMGFHEWVDALCDEDVAALMFTEIPEVGHVNGHSLLAASKLAASISLPVIAHGGVLSRNDLLNLSQSDYKSLHAVTLGKPIFDGVFSYNEAVSLLTH